MLRCLTLFAFCLIAIPVDADAGLFRRQSRPCRVRHVEEPRVQPGYDTPQQAWRAQNDAMRKNDWRVWVNCMPPAQRIGISYLWTVGNLEKISSVSKPHAEAIIAVSRQHGIDLQALLEDRWGNNKQTQEEQLEEFGAKLAEKITAIKDHGRYYADLRDVELKFDPEEVIDGSLYPRASLADLKIDGDRASADVPEYNSKANFQRVDGRWYVELSH